MPDGLLHAAGTGATEEPRRALLKGREGIKSQDSFSRPSSSPLISPRAGSYTSLRCDARPFVPSPSRSSTTNDKVNQVLEQSSSHVLASLRTPDRDRRGHLCHGADFGCVDLFAYDLAGKEG